MQIPLKDSLFPKGTLFHYCRFTDPNIYYQKYKDFKEVNLYRESLFQICPKINFDVHDQFE